MKYEKEKDVNEVFSSWQEEVDSKRNKFVNKNLSVVEKEQIQKSIGQMHKWASEANFPFVMIAKINNKIGGFQFNNLNQHKTSKEQHNLDIINAIYGGMIGWICDTINGRDGNYINQEELFKFINKRYEKKIKELIKESEEEKLD